MVPLAVPGKACVMRDNVSTHSHSSGDFTTGCMDFLHSPAAKDAARQLVLRANYLSLRFFNSKQFHQTHNQDSKDFSLFSSFSPKHNDEPNISKTTIFVCVMDSCPKLLPPSTCCVLHCARPLLRLNSRFCLPCHGPRRGAALSTTEHVDYTVI